MQILDALVFEQTAGLNKSLDASGYTLPLINVVRFAAASIQSSANRQAII